MLELELRGLEVSYGRRGSQPTIAVDGLDLAVQRGEFVSVLGPSGCGKTTVLKVLAGLLKPTRGEIVLPPRVANSNHSRFSLVFQDASLFPWYRISRNVAYGLECQKVPRKEARARAMDYLDLVGLRDFSEHYPHEISGGMQQRANLARALAVNPSVLLMDEPFAALDAQTREHMQSELLRVWSETDKTVLFVTHSIAEAVFLSDRVVVLSSRPARLLEDIAVDLPRPRDDTVRVDPTFRAYEERIRRLIEMQGGPSTEDQEAAADA